MTEQAWGRRVIPDRVWAAQPHREPPWKVADTLNELMAMVDEDVAMDQCTNCGCNTYRIVADKNRGLVLECVSATYADGSAEGCHAQYPIRLHNAEKVVHP